MNDTELSIRVVAMPADTNSQGDIFGGWLLSQMDLAAGVAGRRLTHRRVVTVALDGVVFHRPVYVGDSVSCYTQITRLGNTSATIHVSAFVERIDGGAEEHVCEGHFTMVALDENGKPTPIRHEKLPGASIPD
jgi:acyl-CoA thioesterase YciA